MSTSKAGEPSRSEQTRKLKAEGRGFDPHRPYQPSFLSVP
jgi:hypothetical protein